MADGVRGNEGLSLRQRTIDARNIRELFVGRLSDEEAMTLLRHFNWDRRETVARIFAFVPGELNRLLSQLRPPTGIEPAENRIGCVTRNNVLAELATRNEVGQSCRQFSCEACYNMWWRNVPNRKLVSRCFRCKKKYDALSRDEEWGWGEFECDCTNTFVGWARMGRTTSMCFKCRRMCYPVKIQPPRQQGGDRRRGDGDRRREGGDIGVEVDDGDEWIEVVYDRDMRQDDVGNRDMHRDGGDTGDRDVQPRRRPWDNHSCSAYNCRNRKGQPGDPNQECMHPDRLPRPVQKRSPNHVSTGSTVNTFLPQDDIGPNPYIRSMRLGGVAEGDEPDD